MSYHVEITTKEGGPWGLCVGPEGKSASLDVHSVRIRFTPDRSLRTDKVSVLEWDRVNGLRRKRYLTSGWGSRENGYWVELLERERKFGVQNGLELAVQEWGDMPLWRRLAATFFVGRLRKWHFPE